MKKLVIRQSNSRISHVPSKSYVDNILTQNISFPYTIKQKGTNTLSILFNEHIDENTCNMLSKKLGLEIYSLSSSRCVLIFSY